MMHYEGKVFPDEHELLIYYEVAGNQIPPLSVESWNDGLVHGISEWKRKCIDGIECGYAIVGLLRSMIITDSGRRAGH